MSRFGDIEFERRIFPRFILHLPFTYQIEPGDQSKESKQETTDIFLNESDQTDLTFQQDPEKGVTANASQGGLMVYLPEKVSIGDKIKVRISLAEKNLVKDIMTITEVMWVTKTTLPVPRLYKAGIRFVGITDEALSFLKWFEQLWLEQSG